MGIPVMVIGKSGSGKSTSLRNFEPNELTVFNVINKPLPFRKKLDVVRNATYGVIGQHLAMKSKKCYVIDDSQYLLANEMFDKAKETGYGKFTDMAVRFRNMIQYIQNGIPDDILVYMMHHSELTEDGSIKAKTLGKMLDNQLTVEGLFGIVLYCEAASDGHYFVTQSDGYTTAKSPMEMFDLRIDNDLKMVDAKIREYYGIAPLNAPPVTNPPAAGAQNPSVPKKTSDKQKPVSNVTEEKKSELPTTLTNPFDTPSVTAQNPTPEVTTTSADVPQGVA